MYMEAVRNLESQPETLAGAATYVHSTWLV